MLREGPVGSWNLSGRPWWLLVAPGVNIGDWGELIDAGDPQSGNRFRFRFVFVSCVRASGRGEAVWACERGVFLNAGGLLSNISSGRGFGLASAWFLLLRFVAIYMGFKPFWHGLLLCSWAFWSFLVFDGMLMVFLMLLHTLFAFAAMLMGFLIFSCFWWYAHGFFDAFAHLVRFCCYVHGFLDLF